jgi:predicted HTH domain antitoxin
MPSTVLLSDFDLKMTLAAKLFEEGKLSSGQAADMIGVSKKSFIEVLGKYNVSVFGYSMDEINNDIKNA